MPYQFLSPKEEKSEYDLHENSSDDPGYRRFLARLFDPVSHQLAPNSYGLDFGSGPGPTLSVMFEEAGHSMEIYDPFFAPETIVFSTTVRLHCCFRSGGAFALSTTGIGQALVLSETEWFAWHHDQTRDRPRSFFTLAL